MNEKVIRPPKYLSPIGSPLIFLAGPIQGAKNWQDKAIKLIHNIDPDLYIACPRRNRRKKGKFTQEMYNEQVDWETFHLAESGEDGTVLFWLAKEHEHTCRRAYAQTSRFELSEWKMKHQIYASKLVIGIEDGFTGEKYIRRRCSQDCQDVPIYSTLEETCAEAARLARKPYTLKDLLIRSLISALGKK
ncbi:MAG: hypothetical protein ABIB71_04505 [Candidatus Woesearchaeota archaeon]